MGDSVDVRAFATNADGSPIGHWLGGRYSNSVLPAAGEEGGVPGFDPKKPADQVILWDTVDGQNFTKFAIDMQRIDKDLLGQAIKGNRVNGSNMTLAERQERGLQALLQSSSQTGAVRQLGVDLSQFQQPPVSPQPQPPPQPSQAPPPAFHLPPAQQPLAIPPGYVPLPQAQQPVPEAVQAMNQFPQYPPQQFQPMPPQQLPPQQMARPLTNDFASPPPQSARPFVPNEIMPNMLPQPSRSLFGAKSSPVPAAPVAGGAPTPPTKLVTLESQHTNVQTQAYYHEVIIDLQQHFVVLCFDTLAVGYPKTFPSGPPDAKIALEHQGTVVVISPPRARFMLQSYEVCVAEIDQVLQTAG